MVYDYVTPSSHGNKWGLGGTCVNVGCIPKKLFHEAALLNETRKKIRKVKYLVNEIDHLGLTKEEELAHDIDNFEKLSTAINMHIRKLNFNSRSELFDKNISYKNEFAIFGEDGNVITLYQILIRFRLFSVQRIWMQLMTLKSMGRWIWINSIKSNLRKQW
jgi:thioredoxin reductase (NADPH)